MDAAATSMLKAVKWDAMEHHQIITGSTVLTTSAWGQVMSVHKVPRKADLTVFTILDHQAPEVVDHPVEQNTHRQRKIVRCFHI